MARGGSGRGPSALRTHLARRHDALTSAFLVFPLFLTYQLGILLGARGRNGVDFITDFLIRLCERDIVTYFFVLVAMSGVYAAVFLVLRRKGRPQAKAFFPTLLESGVYALAMGSVILFVITNVVRFLPGLAVADAGPFDILVISAGAGLHEELVFRAGLMGGLARWLSRGRGGGRAWLVALAVSSLAFAAVHHWGPGAEAFSLPAFVYRSLAGVYFALIFHWRGFAVAAWTHCLYDVYVLSRM